MPTEVRIHTFRREDADLGEGTETWLTRCLDSLVAESDELVIDAASTGPAACITRESMIRCRF